MADDLPGPVDFILIEFPDGASTDATGRALSDLVDGGIVRLYDIALISKKSDGTVDRLDVADSTTGAASGFSAFAGAQSGLFSSDDVAEAGDALDAGTTAVMLAYENAWASRFVTAAHGAGGQMIASERIPAQALVDALDAAEAAD